MGDNDGKSLWDSIFRDHARLPHPESSGEKNGCFSVIIIGVVILTAMTAGIGGGWLG